MLMTFQMCVAGASGTVS